MILVADDDEALRELSRLILESSRYHIILAANGREALQLFETNIENIQLAILDVSMPLVSGPEVRAQIVALRPRLPVILITGHSLDRVSPASVVGGGTLFLQKPYTAQCLKDTIRLALELV